MIFALTVNFDLALAYALYPEHTQELNKQTKEKKQKQPDPYALARRASILQSPV
jgi:hypothetical protein